MYQWAWLGPPVLFSPVFTTSFDRAGMFHKPLSSLQRGRMLTSSSWVRLLTCSHNLKPFQLLQHVFQQCLCIFLVKASVRSCVWGDGIHFRAFFGVEVSLHHGPKQNVSICAGSREGKGAVQKMVPGSAVGSISETVKMRSSIPCLIIRPSVRLLTIKTHSMCLKSSSACRFWIYTMEAGKCTRHAGWTTSSSAWKELIKKLW